MNRHRNRSHSHSSNRNLWRQRHNSHSHDQWQFPCSNRPIRRSPDVYKRQQYEIVTRDKENQSINHQNQEEMEKENYLKSLFQGTYIRDIKAVAYTHLDVYKRQVRVRFFPVGGI